MRDTKFAGRVKQTEEYVRLVWRILVKEKNPAGLMVEVEKKVAEFRQQELGQGRKGPKRYPNVNLGAVTKEVLLEQPYFQPIIWPPRLGASIDELLVVDGEVLGPSGPANEWQVHMKGQILSLQELIIPTRGLRGMLKQIKREAWLEEAAGKKALPLDAEGRGLWGKVLVGKSIGLRDGTEEHERVPLSPSDCRFILQDHPLWLLVSTLR